MNKQRLLELAGVIAVGSNMNNPSFEPNAGANSTVDDPTGGQGSSGYAVTGDDGEGEIDPIAKIREEAKAGTESPEAAQSALLNILALLDDFDKINGEEGKEQGEDDLQGPF